jgi:hypothetical protein
VRTKRNFQICTHITSLGCIIVVRLVIGRLTSIYVQGTINRHALGKARLNADPILGIGWIIYFGKIIVYHIEGTTVNVASVSKTSAILYLGDFGAPPSRGNFERAASAIESKAVWAEMALLWSQLCV